MSINRRGLVKLMTGASITGALGYSSTALAAERPPIKAVAFDAFPIFDPRPIFALVNTLYPEQGVRLGQLWRSRQFEYQWLRALAGQYVDFWQATEEGLEFAANQLDLNMSIAKRKLLMNTYLNLKAWPDVLEALTSLKRAGIQTAFLSNMTEKMLNINIENNKLGKYFDHVISTDAANTFKPDHTAYQMGVDTFGLPREQIAFAAFAGWDVAGAKWFGYPTFWVNRSGFKPETLGADADGVGNNLFDLLSFITGKPNLRAKEGVLT
jgi:2-haloacid dehalogenase